MASTSSYFDPTSLLVECASEIFHGVIVTMLVQRAEAYHARFSDIIRVSFNDKMIALTKLDFKRLLVDLLRYNCNRYVTVHQQILDKKLEKSDLNGNNPDHRYYSSLEKLMSQNDGYNHLNCVFDGFIMLCMLQFKYVSAALSHDTPLIGSSSRNRDGSPNTAELTIFNYILKDHLTKANENLQNLYANDDEYKDHRLKCENHSCQLSIEDLLKRLKDQQESIEQQIRNRH